MKRQVFSFIVILCCVITVLSMMHNTSKNASIGTGFTNDKIVSSANGIKVDETFKEYPVGHRIWNENGWNAWNTSTGNFLATKIGGSTRGRMTSTGTSLSLIYTFSSTQGTVTGSTVWFIARVEQTNINIQYRITDAGQTQWAYVGFSATGYITASGSSLGADVALPVTYSANTDYNITIAISNAGKYNVIINGTTYKNYWCVNGLSTLSCFQIVPMTAGASAASVVNITSSWTTTKYNPDPITNTLNSITQNGRVAYNSGGVNYINAGSNFTARSTGTYTNGTAINALYNNITSSLYDYSNRSTLGNVYYIMGKTSALAVNTTIVFTDWIWKVRVVAAPVIFSIFVDPTAPKTTISYTPTFDTNYVNATTTFTLTASDGPSSSGIKYTVYKIDGGSWINYTTPFTIGSSSNGSHVISYNSTDNVGNVETTKTLIVRLDKTAPVTYCTFIPAYGSNWVNATTTFTIRPSDLGSGVKVTYYKEDSGNFYIAPVGGFTLGNLTNGTHVISYYSVDNVGNVQITQSVTVRLDLIAPTTGIAYTPAYGLNWVNATTMFTITPTDAGSGVKATYYKLDGGSFYISPGSLSVGNFTDGTHTIYYYSIDNVGNTQAMQSVTIQFDKAAPVTTCTYTPAYALNWVNAATSFTITPSDADSGVKVTYYKEDSSNFYIAPVGGFTLGNLTNGTHVISYYSVDNVGNVQITQSVTVRLDLIAPTTGIAYTPAYGLNWVNATTTFTITPTDAGSGVKATYYKLDGGSFYISPGSLSVGNFTDGTHTIYYYSVDNAGNTQTMQSAIIQLDKTAPVTTGTYTPAYAPDWVNIATTVTITPSDAGSGVKATYYKLDGGMFYTSPGSFNIGNLTDGSHVISYYSVDNVGNTQSIQQIFLQLDKTSPTSTLSFTPHYGSNYVNSTTIFTISANDFGGSGVGVIYYKTDLIAWTVYSAPFSLNGYPNGTYTIKYYAVDNVGNAESPHQSIVHLDIIGPTIVITSPANQTYGTATINVMLSHADPDYFASWYTITNISNNHVMASNKTWHSPYTSETLTNGAFLIEAWGNDTYGNIKKAASVIFTVDTTAGIPQIQLILPANTTYSNVNLFVEVQNFSRIDTAWFRYFHSGGSWVGNFTLHYNGSYWINNTISLTDDHYQIQVFAERAGHVAQVNKWFTIDTAPPVTTIHVQAAYDNGTKYLNSSSQISFTAIDLSTISVTRFWFDAQVTWQAYLTSFSIGAYNLLNGFHTIYYNSTDIANNNEMTKSTVIYLDTATPGTTISYKAAYAPDWINATTVFTIKPSDLGSGVKATYYKEDSGSYYVAPVSAFALGNLTDGTHMISYYSVDNVGNVQTTQSVTIRLDLLTPTTSIAYTPAYGLNWVNIMTTFTIMPNDADSGVKATYYKLDGGSFYTSPDSFSVGNLTDGTHNIDYFSVDNVGNLQIIQSVIIELDKTAPVTSCTYSPARGTNWVNATTTFTIVPSDAGSGVKITYYQLDSGSFYTSPGSFNIGNLTGGTHTIRYYSMDFVGNVQTIQSFTVRLDKNAPVTVINYTPHHISNFVNASIIFTLSASDYGTGESGVNTTKYRVDSGTWVQYYAAFTLASYVNGTHVIYYFSNDSAGNYEGIKSLSVRLDKNPPVTIINYTRHRVSNFVNATATFTLSATDAGAGESGVNYTFYHIDTQPWVQYSGPFNLSSFGNGTHVIYYYSNDSVGNYEVIKSLSVRLDKNAPVTNISYVQHYILSFVNPSAIFTLSAIDAANGESGVNQTFYMVDSGTWSRYSGSFTLAIYTNGTHAIFYWSNDSAGNYEAIRSLFVRLDRNPPVTRISFTPSQGSNIVNETTIFTMSATDAGAGESGVNQTFYRVDNNPWSQYTGPFTLATLANGTHTIYYYSVDSVGNSEALKSIVVQLGKGPSPSPGPSNNNIELLLIILIAAGAVVVVIAVAIRASKSHSREPVVEPNLTPKQILSRLKHLFVFQRITGSCIVYQPFTQAVFDPQLIAGFLSAITSFGSEIQADAKLRVLEYQSFKILMEETDQCTYALLLEGDLIQQIKDLYHQFIFAFETAYSDDLGKFDGEITPFRSANELIKNIFSVDNLPASNL